MKTTKASELFKVGKNNIGYVSSDFIKEFRNEKITKGIKLPFQKLPRYMSDSEIISELKIQECTLDDILVTLNEATDDMKDGWANIFYVKDHPSRVVGVRWSGGGGGWGVDGWDRGGRWVGGSRVFSPANHLDTMTTSTIPESTLTLDNAIKIVKNAGYKITKEI